MLSCVYASKLHMLIARRNLITGLAGIIGLGVAPSIVRATNIMPVKPLEAPEWTLLHVDFRGVHIWAKYIGGGRATIRHTIAASAMLKMDPMDRSAIFWESSNAHLSPPSS